MEHTSRPQPLVIARVFASLAPTMYLNMYSLKESGNVCSSQYVIGEYLPTRMGHMLQFRIPEDMMKMAAVQTMDPPNVSGVALGLLRNRGSKRWSGGDPFAVRKWIERQLADVD